MDWRRGQWGWLENQGIHWVRDNTLMDTGLVRQGFIGRSGGVSVPPYGSLNIGYSTGDDIQAVRENRRRIESALQLPLESWSCLRQIHGTSVKKITAKEAGLGIMDPEVALSRADAQITDESGVVLVTQHADCIPLYVLDPVKPAIGLAHAGWRGTLRNIAGALVDAMAQAYGSKPADMLAAIGPGAGPCHYEVDEPVMLLAEKCFGAVSGALEALLQPSPNPGRAYLDLWEANALLFEKYGIPAKQISLAGICTICDNDRLFSYRKKDKGRQAAFFSLQ